MKDQKIDRASLLKAGGSAGAALFVQSLLSLGVAQAKTQQKKGAPVTVPMSLGMTLTSTGVAKKPLHKPHRKSVTNCALSGATIWIGLADQGAPLPTPPTLNYCIVAQGTFKLDLEGTDWDDHNNGKKTPKGAVQVLVVNY